MQKRKHDGEAKKWRIICYSNLSKITLKWHWEQKTKKIYSIYFINGFYKHFRHTQYAFTFFGLLLVLKINIRN